MANKTGLMFAQILLILLAIVFALMSACGGFFLLMNIGERDTYGFAPFAVLCLLVGGAIALGLWLVFRKVNRRWQDAE
jgi:hypothetical protein